MGVSAIMYIPASKCEVRHIIRVIENIPGVSELKWEVQDQFTEFTEVRFNLKKQSPEYINQTAYGEYDTEDGPVEDRTLSIQKSSQLGGTYFILARSSGSILYVYEKLGRILGGTVVPKDTDCMNTKTYTQEMTSTEDGLMYHLWDAVLCGKFGDQWGNSLGDDLRNFEKLKKSVIDFHKKVRGNNGNYPIDSGGD